MWEAYCAFAHQFGISPTRAEFASLNGPPLSEVVQSLRTRHNLAVSQDQALTAYQREIHAAWPRSQPAHGAATLLETARDADWRVAVVTSNDRSRVEAWLDRFGLSDRVSTVVGGDVQPGKPDPTPYIVALTRLGCSPEASIAIEDSPQGYRSAAGSGARALFYRPFNREPGPEGVDALPSLAAACPLLHGEEPRLSLRLAAPADHSFLFSLRNDPSVVEYFRVSRALSPEELEARFRPDPTLIDKVTLVAEIAGDPAAMVRFDRQDTAYLVSIIVDRRYRGQGMGNIALRQAMDALRAMYNGATILAEVDQGNQASLRLFEACGFRRTGLRDRFATFKADP